MYRQHFGLRCAPLDKDSIELWDDGAITHLRDRFQWLLDSPGVGLLTGEPGVGKTSTLRHITSKLNPHRYQVIYTAETDFGRVDLYRALARGLGLEPSYRRADLWRDIKQRIVELAQSRQIVPVWIIDESQHLAAEFFRDLPSFLNFSQDARDLITVWLVGHPSLASMLERAQFNALHSRIQVRVHFTPVLERERFSQLIAHALNAAGCTHTLLSDSALEQLREASRGVPRQAGRILRNAMRLAVPKGLNHIPDELLQRAIEDGAVSMIFKPSYFNREVHHVHLYPQRQTLST